MRWLDGITDAMNMNGGKHREMVKEGQGGLACFSSWGRKDVDTTRRLREQQQL